MMILKNKTNIFYNLFHKNISKGIIRRIFMPNIKGFVRYHKLNVSIFIFLVLFSIIHFIKPGFLYNNEGGFRPFGVGYKNKTVIPIWIISIVVAILSYLAVLYYLRHF
jgi:hypothetical protein